MSSGNAAAIRRRAPILSPEETTINSPLKQQQPKRYTLQDAIIHTKTLIDEVKSDITNINDVKLSGLDKTVSEHENSFNVITGKISNLDNLLEGLTSRATTLENVVKTLNT